MKAKLTKEEEQGFKAGEYSQKEKMKKPIRKAISALIKHAQIEIANELLELIK